MLTKHCKNKRRKSLNSAWDFGKVFPEEAIFNLAFERKVVSRHSWHKSKNVKASRADQAEVARELQ